MAGWLMGQSAGKNTPVLESGTLYTNDENTSGIRIDTPAWYAWTLDNDAFYFKSERVGFSLRKERQRNGWFWYAYKRIGGRLLKRYVGVDVTAAGLEVLAAVFLNGGVRQSEPRQLPIPVEAFTVENRKGGRRLS